ncbi:MAG TPA: hydrogenase 4 subunit B, partial [Anaerolineae bacterium]|nr:hydrogenase 4 subunit B [Anaerolineae bacterium]
GAFTGPARSQPAEQATEVPGSMLTGMIILAVGCLALGLGAPIVAPYLVNVITTTLNVPALSVVSGVWVYPVDPAQAVLSTPLIAILLLSLFVVPMIIIAIYNGYKAGRRVVNDPWANGYGYSSQMSISASSFDQPIAVTFTGFYRVRSMVRRPLQAIAAWTGRLQSGLTRAEPMLENLIRRPTARTVDYLGQQIQALQMGDIRMYCLYIIFTLVVLLIAIFH